MTNNQDIRWKQRFSNFQKAFRQFENAVALYNERGLSNLEKQGLVQAFEYTHELAWKTLKDFLEYQGDNEVLGSRDATRKAFQLGLIKEGTIWMGMIKNRNLSTHTYNEETVNEIVEEIVNAYCDEFKKLIIRLKKIA